VQSFRAEVLSWMHRTHSAQQSVRAVEILRGAGTRSLSLDLIFGLPPEVPSAFSNDVEQAIELDPDHLSVYGLTVEPRTPLQRWISRGAATPVPAGRWAEEFLLAHRAITAAGYEHYEVSNYAKPGHRSAHNSAYWTGAPYAGLGPSAHRFDGATRSWNVAPWAEYDRMMRTRRDPTVGHESLTSAQSRLERVYLALRTSDGLASDEIDDLNPEALDRAVDSGWIERLPVADGRSPVASARLRLTAEGWLRLDQLVTALTT
ncbi:MAG: coproporphyrinogen III oxidase, partial [Gemmatimonadota bacterium]